MEENMTGTPQYKIGDRVTVPHFNHACATVVAVFYAAETVHLHEYPNMAFRFHEVAPYRRDFDYPDYIPGSTREYPEGPAFAMPKHPHHHTRDAHPGCVDKDAIVNAERVRIGRELQKLIHFNRSAVYDIVFP
jgi:hypothetical protein